MVKNPPAPLLFHAGVPASSPLFGFPAPQELCQPLGGLAWVCTRPSPDLGSSPHAGVWIDAHDPRFSLFRAVFTRTAARVVPAPPESGFLEMVAARRSAGTSFRELYETAPSQLHPPSRG